MRQGPESGSGFTGLWQERVGSGAVEEEDDEGGWRDEGSQSTLQRARAQQLCCWGVSMVLVLL